MNISIPDIQQFPEYDKHYRVVRLNDSQGGLFGFIALHRKTPSGQFFGATRFWHYANPEDGLRDALRLSRMMSYKAELAGLPCGGAKGVIIAPEPCDEAERARLLTAYAKELSELGETFITGTDVGMTLADLHTMKKARHMLVGFAGDPTTYTALGVFSSIEVALEALDGSPDITGKTFAIQGLGKIGEAILKDLYEKAARVFVTDINPILVEKIKKEFPRVIAVVPSEIHSQSVDVFIPCALSGIINAETLPQLACRAVVGGANNQLASDAMGDALFERNILYVPDYVVNAGGVMCVYDEHQHPNAHDPERIREKVFTIKDTVRSLIAESKKQNRPVHRIANEIAEKLI